MTWTILIFTGLMALWAIVGAGGADNHQWCVDHPDKYLSVKDCEAARNVGTGIGVVLIFLLWMIGFIILSMIWFMTRPKGMRTCPTCGNDVKKGRFVCSQCGYDFRTGHQAAAASDPRSDPTIGTPVEPPPRFDPQTGQPIGPRPRFDPYTGKPLDSQ
jgi:hypothetical protein